MFALDPLLTNHVGMAVLKHTESQPSWCPQEYVQRPGEEHGGTCIVMLSCSPLIVGQELPKQMNLHVC